MSKEETVPPKKRLTAKRTADTEASPIPPQQIGSQQCIPFDLIDSDDEALIAHGEGSTFWRSQKQAKPGSSCRLGVAEHRQPRIGAQYQAVIPEIFTLPAVGGVAPGKGHLDQPQQPVPDHGKELPLERQC